MRTVLSVAILILTLTACGVDPAPAPRGPAAPSGRPTTTEPGPDGPPDVCGLIAPDASKCCAAYLGCSDVLPSECVPPVDTCIEIACPLTDGTTAMPGLCG